MRTLMSIVAVALVSSIMGCCHDTCDSCRDICSSCGSHAGHVHAAPAPAPATMPAPAK